MESLQPSLDIEFKMPTMAVSRNSSENIENQNVENEEVTIAAPRKYYFRIPIVIILTIF